MADEIPKKRLSEGIMACIENARRIYDDANILHKQNRIRNAFFLYKIAEEEIAKAALMLKYLMENQDISEKVVENMFGGHGARLARFYSMVQKLCEINRGDKQELNLEDLDKSEFQKGGHGVQEWKKRTMYVGWENNTWLRPNDFHLHGESDSNDAGLQSQLIISEDTIPQVANMIENQLRLFEKN